MTDAGAPATFPPTTLGEIKVFIADIARPFSIIVTSTAAGWATVAIARDISKHADSSFSEAAIYMGAVFTGLAALYGAKAWEKSQESKHAASAAVAQAGGAQP